MATAGDRPGAGPERAFVAALTSTGQVVLATDESSHLVRSRRVQVGDPVVLFDGAGMTCLGRLVTADPRAACVEIEGPYPDREPARAIRLAMALPEGGRSDQLVSALAELGVGTLLPLTFARSPRGRGELPARRAKRFGRIVREAAKVCGRSRLLEVTSGQAFADWLPSCGGLVFLDPDPTAPRLVDVLPREGELPWLLVGPEGGLDETERRLVRDAGCAVAQVGATALRIETAGMAAAAIAASVA